MSGSNFSKNPRDLGLPRGFAPSEPPVSALVSGGPQGPQVAGSWRRQSPRRQVAAQGLPIPIRPSVLGVAAADFGAPAPRRHAPPPPTGRPEPTGLDVLLDAAKAVEAAQQAQAVQPVEWNDASANELRAEQLTRDVITPNTDPVIVESILRRRIDKYKNQEQVDRDNYKAEKKSQQENPTHDESKIKARRVLLKKLSTKTSTSKRSKEANMGDLKKFFLDAAYIEIKKIRKHMDKVSDAANRELQNNAAIPSSDPFDIEGRVFVFNGLIDDIMAAQSKLEKAEENINKIERD
jgi:hypothetical protein